MANDNPVKQFQKAFDKINQVVDDSLSPSNMKKLAKEASRDMKKRTRRGIGVNENEGSELVLKPLKPITIELRRDLQLKGKLRNETSPEKSNLTRTGQLVDSIQGTAHKKGIGRIFLNSIRFNSKKNNRQVASELSEGGRKFFNLSRKEVISIAKNYSLIFAKEFSKLLK